MEDNLPNSIYQKKRKEESIAKSRTAYLSNAGAFTVFRFQNDVIRFRCPQILERYTEIKEWDHGYLVVMAKYAPYPNAIEEYISLEPILEDLYYDTKKYLDQIEKVCVKYDE